MQKVTKKAERVDKRYPNEEGVMDVMGVGCGVHAQMSVMIIKLI